MTDQELLELAAKAAGVDFDGHSFIKRDRYSSNVWDPLFDDGDAFRLMVALNLDIEFDGPTGMRVNYVDGGGRLCTVEQHVLEDLAEAVRRTIVSAAAELGAEK